MRAPRLSTSGLLTLAAALLLVSGTPALSGCDSGSSACDSGTPLQVDDITPAGTRLGVAVETGNCVTVDYVGRLTNGEQFDAGTLQFVYSSRANLVRGFIEGVEGQRVQQTRRVTVPPSLGYGGRQVADIPACSVLVFDITVTGVNPDTRACQAETRWGPGR